MRISRQIDKLEKDPTIDSNELENKISNLTSQIPSQVDQSQKKECPHCGRSFLTNVAERHIPHCANTKNRPKPPPTKDQLAQKQDRRRTMHLRGSPNLQKMRQEGSPKQEKQKRVVESKPKPEAVQEPI